MTEPAHMMRGADDAARRMRGQARWYPGLVAAFGVITVVIVTLVPVFSGSWIIPLSIAIFVFSIYVTMWRYQRPVRPVSELRVGIWVSAWLVLAIAVVWFVGPDLAGNNVFVWAVLGLVQALPPFIEAGLWTLRSQA